MFDTRLPRIENHNTNFNTFQTREVSAYQPLLILRTITEPASTARRSAATREALLSRVMGVRRGLETPSAEWVEATLATRRGVAR